jgi:hypothetical protein
MKTQIILLLILTTLTSCGISEGLNKNCGSDLEEGCNFLFGTKDEDQDKSITEIEKKNTEQDAKITALELQNDSLHISIDSMSEQIVDLSSDVETNTNDISALNVIILGLQNQITVNLIQLNNLSGNVSGAVTSMINPCGDEVGYFDEVILKTANGKYIAYFEDGGRRFLTEIGAGNFTTTDHERCNFSISNTGVLTF